MTFLQVLEVMGKLSLTTVECFAVGYVFMKAKKEIVKFIAKYQKNA